MIDFIGDIHGHAFELVQLLNKLGYRLEDGAYYHPDRKVCFVGDYIDRGPYIMETLDMVKAMVDRGSAVALMGNHEYNAICYNSQFEDNRYIRKHSLKNTHQHSATLFQFRTEQKRYDYYIDWFRELPLFHEESNWRAVHATWDRDIIKELASNLNDNRITQEVLINANTNGHVMKDLVEITLKGKEAPMPEGKFFLDKDGHKRTDIRIKWWLDPTNKDYLDMSVLKIDELGNIPFQAKDSNFYSPDDKPVFFGHYWLKGIPNLFQGNVCCLIRSIDLA